jgi:hypothetical protein
MRRTFYAHVLLLCPGPRCRVTHVERWPRWRLAEVAVDGGGKVKFEQIELRTLTEIQRSHDLFTHGLKPVTSASLYSWPIFTK